MFQIDKTRYSGRPAEKRSEQEEAIYDKLDALGIAYDRVDHDAANTMEDCLLIESTLGGKICKNLFLCNRQETDFYLLMMPGGKPFKTKYLSAQLGCARLSFANAEHMAELLHTIPGSVSALELPVAMAAIVMGRLPPASMGCDKLSAMAVLWVPLYAAALVA